MEKTKKNQVKSKVWWYAQFVRYESRQGKNKNVDKYLGTKRKQGYAYLCSRCLSTPSQEKEGWIFCLENTVKVGCSCTNLLAYGHKEIFKRYCKSVRYANSLYRRTEKDDIFYFMHLNSMYVDFLGANKARIL